MVLHLYKYYYRGTGVKRVLSVLASLMLVSGAVFADFEDYNVPYQNSQGFQDDSVSSVLTVK